MARHKGKDAKYFDCLQKEEHDYVISLYAVENRPAIRALLQKGCKNNKITSFTHMEVYEYIKKCLDLSIPE